MTKLLEKAFEEASKLPEFEQNALAQWLIDEIIPEKKWEKALAESESPPSGKTHLRKAINDE